jgi:hypothetical protein
MNEIIDEEKKKNCPINGLLDYFVSNFTDKNYEYGRDQMGICRYPLNSEGKRIVEQLEEDRFTYGLDGCTAIKSESIAPFRKGDTPSSIYFNISTKYDDIYSEHFGDLSSPMIDLFVEHTNNHLDLINQKKISDDYQFLICKDFSYDAIFKYDQITQKITRVLSIVFRRNNTSSEQNRNVHCITDNILTTQATLKHMDSEFFNRYYKEKIKEAYPDLSYEQVYELLDLSKWNEHLKSLVKMTYY